MNKMKALLLSAILALGLTTQAQISITSTTVPTNTITGNAAQLYRLLIGNATATAANLAIFDAPGITNAYAQGAYTNRTQYMTNLVTTYTNFQGVISTNTNSYLFSLDITVAAAQKLYPRMLQLVIPPTNTVDISFPVPYIATFGLLATNDQTLSISAYVLPLR